MKINFLHPISSLKKCMQKNNKYEKKDISISFGSIIILEGEHSFPKFLFIKKMDIVHFLFYNLIDQNQIEKRYDYVQ